MEAVVKDREVTTVWLVAPLPDTDWGSDLRPTAKLFESEAQARAILENCPPRFHLWRATRTITRHVADYVLVD